MRTQKSLLTLIGLILLLVSCGSPSTEAGPPLLVDPGIDPNQWATIPAGEFLQGQFNKEVLLDYEYDIMITNVTNKQFVKYLNQALAEGAIKIVDEQIFGYYPGDIFREYRHEVEITAGDWLHVDLSNEGLRYTFDGDQFTVKSGYENHPVVLVTWFGAQAYCEYNDARLPSDYEWEKAGRGTDGRAFPWGNEVGPENANYYASRDPFEEYIGKMGDTSPVGFYNGTTYMGFGTVDSASPYGLYDMAGNVEEWVGNVYEDQHYRYMHGGSKANYSYDLRIWGTNNAEPDYFGPSTGFRCVRD